MGHGGFSERLRTAHGRLGQDAGVLDQPQLAVGDAAHDGTVGGAVKPAGPAESSDCGRAVQVGDQGLDNGVVRRDEPPAGRVDDFGIEAVLWSELLFGDQVDAVFRRRARDRTRRPP